MMEASQITAAYVVVDSMADDVWEAEDELPGDFSDKFESWD